MLAISLSSRARKALIAIAVALLHVLAVLFLVRAFAPGILPEMVEDTLGAVAFEVPADPPAPEVEPSPVPDEGASGEEASRATPREVAAPEPKVRREAPPAPRASSSGTATRSGGAESRSGTGAGGPGTGTGSGRGGDGRGGYFVTKPVKIAGDITSARDYPRETRDLRDGQSVAIDIRVGVDGMPTGCRVVRPSPDPQSDRITCQLAVERFRFKPAMDPDGQPVVSTFRWYQRWFE
jgi:protein TonB